MRSRWRWWACASSARSRSPGLSFFITSVGSGKGADFGGLEGADKHCQQLAQAAGAGNRTWRAYLSAGGAKPVNAKDRIGAGPWQNAKGVVVATSVADLHSDSNKLSKENSLTEKGAVVNGRGDTPNTHDILTGSNLDGTLAGDALTCNNWTSSGEGSAQAGPPRPAGRRSEPDVVELRARHQGLQPGQPGRDRRGGADLLLRGEIGSRLQALGSRQNLRMSSRRFCREP